MTSRTPARRRVLPGSPFPAPPAAIPASEHVAVDDLVTHDRHGVGRVARILDDVQVLVRFSGDKPLMSVPHVKLTRL